LLTDDLIDEPLGDLHFRRGMEIDLANPRIHGGEFLRVSHRLHHLLTVPALGSRSNTRAFHLNTSRMLPRSSCRNSDTAQVASSPCTQFCAPQNPSVALPTSRRVSLWTMAAKQTIAAISTVATISTAVIVGGGLIDTATPA